MARKAKAPVEGGKENFQTPRNAGQNGAQNAKGFGEDYPADADRRQQGAVRSDKFRRGDPMSDEDVGALIQQELTDARTYIDLEVGPMRAAATMAYRGVMDYASDSDADDVTSENYLDEAISPATRSEISSRDVRDSILGLMPDLMRIFASTQTVCEYTAENIMSIQVAEQATDYANYVFMRDNPGFMNLHSLIKDALKYKTSVCKVWWDDSERVRTEHYRNLTEVQVMVLEQDEEVEKIEVMKQYKVDEQGNLTETAPSKAAGQSLVDVKVTRRVTTGRTKIEPLPSEEFLIDRRARSLYCEGPSQRGFTVCGHRTMKTVSEMVALGFDEDIVREHVTSPEMDTNVEYIARQPWARVVGSFDGMNPSTQRLLVVEAYAWIDSDGDGIAELWQIWCAGPSYKVIHREMVDYLPFADFQCDPEPHTFFGESIADVTMDIQRIKTQIWRDTLDSLAQSIRPRMAIVEGQVNYEDVMNNEIGAIIRMRQPGMVTPLDTPFVGQQAFPMIEYTDQVLEKRTGVSLQSMGLDADTLQSTTKLAVQQQVSSSQGRVQLLARILAEGMRKVFKLILYLICTHQDRPRIIQIRGKFVPIDPRYWNADMNVEIAVGLGNGTTDQQIQILMGIKEAQEQILQTLGPTNPICSLGQYSYTLRKLAELSGFRDATKFFNELPADFKMPPSPQPPPNPQVIDAQTNQQKAQAQQQLDTQKFQLDQWKAQQENSRLHNKDAAQIALQMREMEMRYGQQSRTDLVGALQDFQNSQRDQDQNVMMHGASLSADRAKNADNNQSKERIASIMARAKAAQPQTGNAQ